MISPDQIASETLQAENADCSLTVTLEFAADALHVQYNVRNRGILPIYLLNRLWNNIRRDSTTNVQVFETLPDLATIQVDPTEVVISKTVVDVPYLMLVEVRQIPCMTRVDPGDSYEETIHLSLPLMPYTVYERAGSLGSAVLRNLRFELGYIQSSPLVERIVEPVVTPTGNAFYIEAFPARDQSIICVGPFKEAVPVTKQVDARPAKPVSTGEWNPWE